MKFRSSLQVLRDPTEDGTAPNNKPKMPFRMSSLRNKRAKTDLNMNKNCIESIDEDVAEWPTRPHTTPLPETTHPHQRSFRSRKQALQDFFRNTRDSIKAQTATTFKPSSSSSSPFSSSTTSTQGPASSKLPCRTSQKSSPLPPKPSERQAASKRQSRQIQALDIDENVLDKLLGPEKGSSRSQSRVQSEAFFLKQRIRASSRAAASSDVTAGLRALKTARETEEVRDGANEVLLGDEDDAATGDLFLVELPSMLSAQGLDPGTVGFEHFLQLPLADGMAHAEEPVDFTAKRSLLVSAPEQLGVRELDTDGLVDRLIELEAMYEALQTADALDWSNDKLEEMGEDLFTRFLDAELGTTRVGTGCVSLRTQVEALVKVLGQEGLWWDFSLVEWRIRVGQILWGDVSADELGGVGERNVLLLQVTLAAELLIRLMASESMSSDGVMSPSDVDALRGLKDTLPRKLQYDLLLARIFLGNVAFTARATQNRKTKRTSTLSARTFLTAKESPLESEAESEFLLVPKHGRRQVSGLVCFANALCWPHGEDVEERLGAKAHGGRGKIVDGDVQTRLEPSVVGNERPPSGFSAYATPLSSPLSPNFLPDASKGGHGTGIPTKRQSCQRRPELSRKGTSASVQLLATRESTAFNEPDAFQVGSWLTKSWLAGLVFPGEAASHFLISTLLENSPEAIETLGDQAELYGGFVYRGLCYWSKSCVVGRVLGAVKGSKECMGWVSVPLVPKAIGEGWMEVHVRDLPALSFTEKPRIKMAEAVVMDSDPLHGASEKGVQASDFTTPLDGPLVMGNEVRFLAFSLQPNVVDQDRAAGAQTAHLSFSSPINKLTPKLDVELTYDVHFIASINRSFKDLEKDLPPPPGHPLHSDYQYTIIPAASLLKLPSQPPLSQHGKSSRPRALSTPSDRAKQAQQAAVDDTAGQQEVVILDCRGTADLELLARAWCAKVGENALVGKTGRTCLACCVRESRALGVGVVIRI
ncbi:hypothetical protein B0A50_04398 [Salinomyces thailandicus]|uniref:Uncharacterized protein n=1 Tax=Salinomyces thailandicus TaxID=706561 RepID=A0A4U0TYR3_9PEZI|nr:hypothetical protein B0A50_04398 [Salinomyces thailandica]